MGNFKKVQIEDKLGVLINELECIIKKDTVNSYIPFLSKLDKISKLLYNKNGEKGFYAIDLSEYSDGENGYFDQLFRLASILIYHLIDRKDWNIILKMDTHNNPQGYSNYSLIIPYVDPVTHENTEKYIIKDKECNSLAYTLFFDYSEFCNSEKKAGNLPDDYIYTVHKEFINEKTARSFSYELNNIDGKSILKKYTDGKPCIVDDNLTSNAMERKGKKYYLDFINCILDKKIIDKNSSNFSTFLLKDETDNSWKKGANSMRSFSYYNLGIPGFESWGTLMIESNDDAETVYKVFYREDGDNDDTQLLIKIKNIISALKKIDDEYNDALNKQKIRKESIKSAKAAIMARNMSHNIGSHVMSYLKQKLGNITSIMSEENKVLYNLTDDKYLHELLKQKELDGNSCLINNIQELLKQKELSDNVNLRELLVKILHELTKQNDLNVNNSFHSLLIQILQELTTQKKPDENTALQELLIKNLQELLYKNKKEGVYDENKSEITKNINEQTGLINSNVIQKKKKTIQFPFLVGTGRFLGYLQERQDYIATIATDYIPYGAPVNMKDAIYDELNPDLRHMRHNDDDGNQPMNVLLAFIAKSEGLSRENMKNDNSETKYDTQNDILFGFPKYESENVAPHIFGLSPTHCDSDDPALTEMRKMNFSLPGGLVGRQAIFSIVENLIRNAAKHGSPRSTKPNNKGNLELTFDVLDLADIEDCKCLDKRICDPIWRALYKSSSDREQLFLFTITDNLIYTKELDGRSLAEKLRPALIEDYIDEKGNMSPTNKGIKEIRISAAWMRNEVNEERYLRYEDYKGSDEPLPDKKAPLVGLEMTDNGHLRYMICVPQDRLCAVITQGMSDVEKDVFEELHRYSPKDWTLYKDIDEAKKKNKISFHYMFVANEDVYNRLRPYTSNRLFVWNLTDFEINGINGENLQRVDNEKYTKIKNRFIRRCYNINDESEPIYIWDGKTLNNIEKNGDEYIKDRIIVSSNDTNTERAQYVYRTHHSTESQFETYWMKKTQGDGEYKDTYNNIIRIDAITGDNSSDRIVRREPLNEEWYCSHLRALKKRIAIFDERLFKIVHNVEESKFIISNYGTADTILENLINRLDNGEELQVVQKDILDNKLLGEESGRIVKFSQSVDKLRMNLEKRKKIFHPYKGNKTNYKSIVFQEKGVDVFTIVKEGDNKFAVIGYVDNKTEDGVLEEVTYDKVATITSKDTPFTLDIKFHHPGFENEYDYISIHQGILDKIYEGFGIKDQGGINDSKKCTVTKRIHEFFMKKGKYVPIKVFDDKGNSKEDYLPCFIIHSGRAKPTKNDMPQEQPFIQYAAIEHAVLDCKFSLVELLDYARFES